VKSRRLANISHVWLLVPWLGIVLAARRPIRDNSFLWHVQAGHLQQSSGQVLVTDPFSLAFYGEPWRTQSWLLELIYARLGDGLEWVGSFVGIMAGLTLLAAGVAIYQSTRSIRLTGGLMIWLELLALPYFAPRPVIVSFVFLSLLLVVLRSRRLRWAIPLLLWVWASMHGSFVLGIGLVVLDGLARRDRRRVTDVIAGTVAVSITAHGWHVWEILLTFLGSSDGLGYLTEWAAPDVLSPQVLPFTALVVAMYVVATRGGLRTRILWVVAPFVVFGLSTSRAIMPAGLVLMVYLAAGVGRVKPRTDQPSAVATVLVVALAVVPLTLSFAHSSQLDPVRFPVALAASLEDLPTFHDDVVGGYLIFRGEAPSRVLFDDRADLYPEDFFGSLVTVRSGTPLWQPFFQKYEIDQVLIRHSDGLARALEESGEWVEVASDAEFTIWRRRSA
jgi:hypothetical protein